VEYEIVKYQPEFRRQVVELQAHLWGAGFDMNTAYLEWKHEHNPYVDTPLIYVALYGQKVIGMRAFFGCKWEVGDPCETFLGPCAGDLVVDPEHRRRGVFTKIMGVALSDLAEMGYTYIFNFSGNEKTVLGSLKQGWRSAGSLQPIRRKAGKKPISRRMQRYVKKLPFLSSGKGHPPFYFLDKNSARQRGKVDPHVSMGRTPRPQAMSQLVEQMGHDGRIRHVRDHPYFAWRFQNPRRSYRFLFWERDSLEGYLVLQTKNEHKVKSSARIVDWEATNHQVRADLLQAAIRWGRFHNLFIWSAPLPEETNSLLQDTGFQHIDDAGSVIPESRPLLIRPVRDEMLNADWVVASRRLLDLANWDFRMIYSDGI
jgi:GNAT superfamily N-acetyltransferase